MDHQTEAQTPIDHRQAEAIAQALLAEGRARQRERVLQRWRMRQMRRGQGRAALLALAAAALAGWIAHGMGWRFGALGLAAVWASTYLLARRAFAPRALARAVIES